MCEEMSLSKDIPMVIADSNDISSIKSMVDSCKVVLTTVGPYQLYGNELVAACASAGK